MSTNVYAKFRCGPLRIKKALRIFRQLKTTTRRTRTTGVALWGLPSGSKNRLHSKLKASRLTAGTRVTMEINDCWRICISAIVVSRKSLHGSGHLEDLGLADVQYLYGHATLVAADLLKDGVEPGVELSPVLELGVRTGVIGLASHLLAL